jgi:hypothetical protein
MIFSDESAGICEKVVIGFYEIVWLPAEVSATLKRPGVKTRDLKRNSGLMRETVIQPHACLHAVMLNLVDTGTFLFIAVVSPLALLPPSVDSTLKSDSHIASSAHAMPLIHTRHAVPLSCSDSAVSFIKVCVAVGNIRTSSPTV